MYDKKIDLRISAFNVFKINSLKNVQLSNIKDIAQNTTITTVCIITKHVRCVKILYTYVVLQNY